MTVGTREDRCRADETTTGIIVLTGARQAGKTSACRRLVTVAAARGVDIAGVLSPALFENGMKTGIQVADLRSGRARHLATRRPAPRPGDLDYQFEQDALAWADSILAFSTPCDLLIIDEVGPLEIEQGRGFGSTFDVLRGGLYRLAVVVVRPALIGAFTQRLGMPCEVMSVEHGDVVDALLSRLADSSPSVCRADDQSVSSRCEQADGTDASHGGATTAGR